ncbi:acetoacetyl-CoA synthetase-like isoform X2 [Argiope bruennichi]|nr:acetoacetyl-CoA synthetase-like isoform X2 [Argiope bruennichi]
MDTRKKQPFLAWNKKVTDTNTEKFRKLIEEKYQIRLENYWDLHKWSVDNTEKFWEEIWDYFKVIASQPYEKAFVKTGPGFLDNKWFTGAKLNYAENLMRMRGSDTIALACLDEEDNFEELTHAQLYEEVKLYAAAFRKHGLKSGDVVAGFINNRKDAVIGCLAAASIGAIWSGIQVYSGGKAGTKIAQRMEPKFLIAVDRFQIEGAEFPVMDKVPGIVDSTPSIEKVVIIPTRQETLSIDTSNIRNCCFLPEFLESGKNPDGSVPEIVFEQLPFDHPLFLVFTSGTTGLPKAPVHGGGTFLPLLIDIAFHWNLKPGDTLFSFIPMGWAVWNWFLPAMALGVRLMLYSGSSSYIRNGLNMWDTLAKYKATWWFVEPCSLDKIEKKEMFPKPESNLDHLKAVCICGSPVKVQNIAYIQSKIKKDVFAASLYGTTESHGFLSGYDWNLPSYAGEVQVPALGKDIHCFDSQGRSVVGKLGELVITTRSPSFPLYLWKDEDGSVVHKAYLDLYPGTWCPHDECWINPKSRGIVIVGRSDDTLIQNGECFGSADIYFAIHDMEEIIDYICVGQTSPDGDVRVVLFVKLAEGVRFSPELNTKICQKIEVELWRELVPELVLDVKDIPYNLNGKRMESTVKKIIHTNKIPEVNNIRNPESLQSFCNRPEVISFMIPAS